MSSRSLGQQYTPHSSGSSGGGIMGILKKLYGVPEAAPNAGGGMPTGGDASSIAGTDVPANGSNGNITPPVSSSVNTYDPNSILSRPAPFKSPGMWGRLMGNNADQLNTQAIIQRQEEVDKYNIAKALEAERANQSIREAQTLQEGNVMRQLNLPVPFINGAPDYTKSREITPLLYDERATGASRNIAEGNLGITKADELDRNLLATQPLRMPIEQNTMENAAKTAMIEGNAKQLNAQGLVSPLAKQVMEAKQQHELGVAQAPVIVGANSMVDPITKRVIALPGAAPNLFNTNPDIIRAAEEAASGGKSVGELKGLFDLIDKRKSERSNSGNITPPVSNQNKLQSMPSPTVVKPTAVSKSNPPPTNAKGWILHIDANGNKAYVGPNNEIEVVR